jgi:hypothetical protein
MVGPPKMAAQAARFLLEDPILRRRAVFRRGLRLGDLEEVVACRRPRHAHDARTARDHRRPGRSHHR